MNKVLAEIPRQPQKVVAVDVAVAVAEVITVGRDHHPSLRLGAWLDPGKACS